MKEATGWCTPLPKIPQAPFDIDELLITPRKLTRGEAFCIIDGVIDTLIEVGNGVTDEMLHADADKLFLVRDYFISRTRGTWVNVQGLNFAECDQCGYSGRAWMNFCPICGADMRGDAE